MVHSTTQEIARMTTIQSPFNEISTFILSPAVSKTLVVFIHKPVAKLPDFIDHGESPEILPYEICLLSATGTISIHTLTQEFYESALNYLSHIYESPPHDEDAETVLWEC